MGQMLQNPWHARSPRAGQCDEPPLKSRLYSFTSLGARIPTRRQRQRAVETDRFPDPLPVELVVERVRNLVNRLRYREGGLPLRSWLPVSPQKLLSGLRLPRAVA